MSKVELFEKERAAGYNQFVETWIPNYQTFLDSLPELLRETRNKSLLVVGCGTGNEIERFVRAPEEWRITGIDPSPEMISQAAERLSGTDVKLVSGLVSDLDSHNRYGAATLLLVLHFMEDDGTKLGLLRSIADRLEPGAPLVVLDITGTSAQLNQNLAVLRLLLPRDLPAEDVQRRLSRIENELHAVSEERLCELFMEAGFEQPLRFFQTSIYAGWLARRK